MDRLESFEKMLADLIRQAEQEQAEMERLKMAGKEKTATYRQYELLPVKWKVEKSKIVFTRHPKRSLVFSCC